MRLGSISLQVDKSDAPKYYRPQSAIPNGWISLGGMASLILPNDPAEALHYLNVLYATVREAYGFIATPSNPGPDDTPTQVIPEVLENKTYL